jgi:transposase-like protein
MIISLYARGMTLRDVQHHLVCTIGAELSHETISKITDQLAEEVLELAFAVLAHSIRHLAMAEATLHAATRTTGLP